MTISHIVLTPTTHTYYIDRFAFLPATNNGRTFEPNAKPTSLHPTNNPLRETVPYPSQGGPDSSPIGKGPNSVINVAPDVGAPGFKTIPDTADSRLPGFKTIPDGRITGQDTSSNTRRPQTPLNGLGGSHIPSLSQTLPGQANTIIQPQTDLHALSPNTNQLSDNTPSQFPSTSDLMTRIRNAFKLPPGICLVRCDSLKSDQVSLTPEQVKDAFASAGLFGMLISLT